MYDDTVISISVRSINIKIPSIKKKYKYACDIKDTDEIEIRALKGISILAGVTKFDKPNIVKLFNDSKETGLKSVFLTIYFVHFKLLLRNLRFNDFTKCPGKRKIDKLSAIRKLFKLIIQYFQKNIIPSL